MDPLQYLFGLEQFGIKFGLDNITAIVARLGHPERAFTSVHIAGTNGKGSVTAMVDAALRAAGHESARYTSPHLVDLVGAVRHRRPAGRRDATSSPPSRTCATRSTSLRADGELEVQPTFFEVTTAVAFELFRRAGVEIAVLEVGLGGRLDATNVVAPPHVVATAITSIAFDHQLYLGPTLREIALEKAGIIKPGVPVVVGPLPSRSSGPSIERGRARARRRRSIQAAAEDAAGFAIGLRGAHQIANAAVAVRLLQIARRARRSPFRPQAIAAGLADPGWPGRLETRSLSGGREMLLDAAHNPAGAAALASYLEGDAAAEAAAGVRGDARQGRRRHVHGAASGGRAGWSSTRASNPRSAEPAALAERARAIAPGLPDLDRAGRRRRAGRQPGAIRRASSSPDRFSCSATC